MRINKYSPHLLVLPEDKANSDIVNGFLLHPQLNQRAIQILPPAGGWTSVIENFVRNHVSRMRQHSERWMVFLIDFDMDYERCEYIFRQIPGDLRDRVFVLGVLDEPEALKKDLQRSLELIGEDLAANCAEHKNELWEHDLLKHNKAELERMASSVKHFLFNHIDD
ncbi:hypothetical protein ACQ4N7_27540 [Nodosilinea sp. AN01ver1]|uniref:hypothetical protein n=1 Tax=Nodosilinea sp. AN01ver1 TaxID=3423362 RepID=UPI003D317D17